MDHGLEKSNRKTLEVAEDLPLVKIIVRVNRHLKEHTLEKN